MSAVLNSTPSSRPAVLEWLPVLAGLLVLYVPTFYDLSNSLWREDEYAHGPIILGVVAWLMWRQRRVLMTAPPEPAPITGIGMTVFGLLTYVLGRFINASSLEVGALVPILAGTLLAMRGWPVLRAFWFPILFVVFMVPLPGFLVDALTGPLKQQVSQIAEHILYALGYPIARDGVMLTIGRYQLLVADACSGLNSMLSLSALGLLYLYLMRHGSWLHNGLILLCVLPIAFTANIIRVLILVLVTYHFGDAAGQSFLHGGAGIVLLLTALTIILLLDAILSRLMRPQERA